ncbi:MAG: nicotinamide riboside transporter PnuC [Tannerella sp.]|jgi:nicotinamide mononucleotide transporter|nr:nicotinamide riboside transporter PnuC [Tannerella sp.]
MTVIEIIGAAVALLYLRLEYRASILMWPAGVLMTLFYIYIFYAGKFYAEMSIHIYYMFASIYGWVRWRNDRAATGRVQIASLPRRRWWLLSAVAAGLFGMIAATLCACTDSPAPFGDAFTTALSIVAMWLLAHRFMEQWLLWVAVNAVSTALYFSRGLYPTAVLFAIYTAVSMLGYLKWRKMRKEEQSFVE